MVLPSDATQPPPEFRRLAAQSDQQAPIAVGEFVETSLSNLAVGSEIREQLIRLQKWVVERFQKWVVEDVK